MTYRDQLMALADRVEKAKKPCAQLDAEIQVRLFEKRDYCFPDKVLNRRPSDWREACGRFRWDGGGGEHPWPAYTNSIGDAEKLVPTKPPRSLRVGTWWWTVETLGVTADVAYENGDSGIIETSGDGATVAMALCAAAIRAHAEASEFD